MRVCTSGKLAPDNDDAGTHTLEPNGDEHHRMRSRSLRPRRGPPLRRNVDRVVNMPLAGCDDLPDALADQPRERKTLVVMKAGQPFPVTVMDPHRIEAGAITGEHADHAPVPH